MEANHIYKENICIMKLCSKVKISQKSITIQCDSVSATVFAKNLTFHVKTKHIHIQYNFFRDMVKYGKVRLEKINTL